MKILDIIILILISVFGFIFIFLTQGFFIGKPIISVSLLLVAQVIYLSLRAKKNWLKIIVATVVFGGLFGFFLEFINEFTKSYQVVQSAFPFKIFGVIPPDNILGHMVMAMTTFVFYQHFIESRVFRKISRAIRFPIYLSVFAIVALLVLFFYKQELLTARYPYALLGSIAILPVIYLAVSKPKFIRNLALIFPYFFGLYFIIELFAVNFGWWIYPGNNYVGWINLHGFGFPLEELFFWTGFYAPALGAWYELFINGEIMQKT